jgi:ribosome-associated toxin RatA of RatAB toxin-antitoxin module
MKLTVLLCLSLAVSAARAEDVAEERRRLEAREVLVTTQEVPGRSLPRVKAKALIRARPAEVWAIVQDCGHYKETMPRIVDSRELSREGDKVICRVEYDLPFPLGSLWSETEAVHTVQPGRLYRRAWRLRRGDFVENTGSWTLEPYGAPDITLVTYDISSEPNVRLPAFVLEMGQKRTLPELFEGLRERLEVKRGDER